MNSTVLLLFVIATTTAVQCCDPKHGLYLQMNNQIKACVERQGVPIVRTFTDEGAHPFQELIGCSFPCREKP
jgi:hypothetical protein